jgi:methylase of polypeptide subunit release factors
VTPAPIIAETVDRLARRAAVTEADIQSDVRLLLLHGGFDLDDRQVVLEAPAGGGRRIDVEVGSTVVEVKKNLESTAQQTAAVGQLADYLHGREAETGRRFAGVLTDGVVWQLHYMDAGGAPQQVASLRLEGGPADAERLTVWLEGITATARGVDPTAVEIRRRLGAESSGFALDLAHLADLYRAHGAEPSVALKRELWSRLLASALGTHFDDSDELFVLHTYLVISAELIAHAAVGLPLAGQRPQALLSGDLFQAAQLGGVVEPDFFDWPVEVEGGVPLVHELARKIDRFDWSQVDHDALKVLYESVIDAETRKRLGEYYTPDWLAEAMVGELVDDPLHQRVLDPSCGSGTFVFWAVRRYLEAAEADGHSNVEAVRGAIAHVAGIDLHPVAVALARVTYVLAIGARRLQSDRPPFSVPVYLGDSLRWDADDSLLSAGGLRIPTSDAAELFAREFFFPERVVADAARFDELIAELSRRASERERGAPVPSIDSILRRYGVHPDDQDAIRAAFRNLCVLHDEGRDHIWGYYIRNQARPLWFTQPSNQVDVLVGNPPWLAYRFMGDRMQQRYRVLSQERGTWAGRHVSTHQDLSDLFVVRTVEQYLRDRGRFGFVMPAATLSRQQFAGFRSGLFQAASSVTAIAFAQPWDLRRVDPDPFPVPCCVVSGAKTRVAQPLPAAARAYAGRVSGTRWSEVRGGLETATADVVQIGSDEPQSPYAERFAQGATVLPRVLLTVERVPAGPLGAPVGTVSLQSRRSRQEKAPWKDLEGMAGLVEERFVRPMLVGIDIAPFRVFDASLAVIPWTQAGLLEGKDPGIDAYPNLAAWWRAAEEAWERNKGAATKLSLREQLDYFGKLTAQFPLPPERVVYTKAGTRVVAARVSDPQAIIDHTLYWAAVSSADEGAYLAAILNSNTLDARVQPLMSEGLFGKRHADKYVFYTTFPTFEPEEPLHAELAALGHRAEGVAAALELGPSPGFGPVRRAVRAALDADGVTAAIDAAVDRLVPTIA